MRFQDVSGDLGKFQRFQGKPRAFSKLKGVFQSSRDFREFQGVSGSSIPRVLGVLESFRDCGKYQRFQRAPGFPGSFMGFKEFQLLLGSFRGFREFHIF